jgi:hypothetical protein
MYYFLFAVLSFAAVSQPSADWKSLLATDVQGAHDPLQEPVIDDLLVEDEAGAGNAAPLVDLTCCQESEILVLDAETGGVSHINVKGGASLTLALLDSEGFVRACGTR